MSDDTTQVKGEPTQGQAADTTQVKGERTFTQAELDLKVQARVAEEKAKYKDYDYLTRSFDAAHLISAGLRRKDIFASVGCVHEDARIPAIYHGKDWYYVIAEYHSEAPEYGLTVC